MPANLPPRPVAAPAPAAETFAVSLPGTSVLQAAPSTASAPGALPSEQPLRVAVLLPLRSDTLGPAAAALRAGLLAAWERDRDNLTLEVIDSGELTQDVLSSYAAASNRYDLLIGPLSRAAVAAVADSALVLKPTIALNTPEAQNGPLPPLMLAIGLSIEEEARQAALWAARQHPHGRALVLATGTAWQRRVAYAFAEQWQHDQLHASVLELGAQNGYLSDPELVRLRARIQSDPPTLIFAALGADQTRQLRIALLNVLPEMADDGALPDTAPATGTLSGEQALTQASILPIYGTSALNPGSDGVSSRVLDGVRLLDLPWQLQRDHPAVMVYPRPPAAGGADLQRLYALGIDAYRITREIARQPVTRFHLDGVTGRLTIRFGDGPASFERLEQAARYLNGVAQPVPIP
ncbi:MAG: penicillin-binding protein activator [Sphingomonadaceae bacterium]